VDYVVLDTDVSSLILRDRLTGPLVARLTGRAWCVTFVTVGELWQWAPRPANDTWIAATCLSRGLPLATHNAKDFQDFADRDGLVLCSQDSRAGDGN
jgi:predicted nucleic acid-binding protein